MALGRKSGLLFTVAMGGSAVDTGDSTATDRQVYVADTANAQDNGPNRDAADIVWYADPGGPYRDTVASDARTRDEKDILKLTVFEQVNGEAGLPTFVSEFTTQLAADVKVNGYFLKSRADLERFSACLVEQLGTFGCAQCRGNSDRSYTAANGGRYG